MTADLVLVLVITHVAAVMVGALSAHLVDCGHCHHRHHIED
ncbi:MULTISPECIES: hypothetical protein [Mycobacterium avium complex (MAC)]|nr:MULTISPECIES: hypothetical protein [Mycobacterium avium complex (MAC)]ETB35097.1 hypothetical protein N602_27480 [Mycobacterium avium subsp. hominissuis 10-5606]MDO2381957.1 hypothetical protein [Mycobacterium avium subsp. hominissuis]MDO2394520.1 hypothetical protein [Mycobacterium avium subsp. hominissuis]